MPLIKNIEKLDVTEIKNGMFLMLNNIADLPVHIGLLYFNRYYATTIQRVYKNIDGDIILKKINQKKTPVLLFKLEINSTCNNNTILKHYNNVLPLKKTYALKYTCLNPVEDLLSLQYKLSDGASYHNCENVFDLLERLEKNNKIIKTYHLNCENYLTQNSLELNFYTKQETISKIKRLIETAYVKG